MANSIDKSVFIAGGAQVVGDGITIGKDSSIGYNCVIRCDHGQTITIGENTLIGMGSIVMDNVKIGRDCIIGAGSLVTEGTVIPDGTMYFGRPARYVRDLTPEEIEDNRKIADGYVTLKDEWMERKSD